MMMKLGRIVLFTATLATVALAQDFQQGPPPDGGQQTAGQQQDGGRAGGRPNFQGVGGEITRIEGSVLTLTTFRGETAKVSVSDSTRIMKDGAAATLGDLKVGDRIMARGQQGQDGVWVAEGIRSGQPGQGGPGGQGGRGIRGPGGPINSADNGKTYIAGTITKIEGLNLTVQKPDGSEQVIAVDDDTSFRNARRQSVTLADIKLGEQVRGGGEVKNGVFVAKELIAGPARQTAQGSGGAPQGPPPDGAQGAPPPADATSNSTSSEPK